MRLKDCFITHNSNGEKILVDTSAANFVGIARSNETAAFILEILKNDITKEQIVDAMMEEYKAPSREKVGEDVDGFLNKLNGIGALEGYDR